MRRTRLNSSVDSVFEIPRRSILNQMNHWTGGQIADEINDYLSETNPNIRVTNAFFTGNTLGIEYTAPDQDEAEDAFYYVLSDRYTPINSSRRSLKTQRAIRHCINSARRRAGLNCNIRYSTKYRVKPNGDSFTLYFISDDGLNNAVFDIDPDFQGACNVEGEILSAESNWEIDSYENWFNSFESRDIYELLRYDAEGSTGVDMHECSEADYNASCVAIEQAKGQLNSARR